MKLLLIVAMAV
jgi:hypothetical protein